MPAATGAVRSVAAFQNECTHIILQAQVKRIGPFFLAGEMRPQLVLLALLTAGCASAPASAPPSVTANNPGRPDRIVASDEMRGGTIRAPGDAGAASVTLPATADQVFDAITTVFAYLKVPVTYSEKTLGEQGNRKFVMSRRFDNQSVSEYLNCGDDPMGGPNANAYPVTVSLVTRSRASGGTNTVLETILTGITYKPGANSGAIYCASTGTLEGRIAEMVASRLPKAQ